LKLLSSGKIARPGSGRTIVRKAVLRAMWLVARPLKPSTIGRAINGVAKLGSKRRTRHIGVAVGPYHESVPHSVLSKSNVVDFEGEQFAAPSDTDKLLSTLYGNYLKLPPEQSRETHHAFTAYRID